MADQQPFIEKPSDAPSRHETQDIEQLLPELESRCEAAQIRLELDEFQGTKYVRLHFPAGRNTEPISLFNASRVKSFLAIPFERYVLLGDYAAYCSYADGFIEARISLLAPNSARLFPHLASAPRDADGHEAEAEGLRISNPAGSQTLVLCRSTATLEILGGSPMGSDRPSLRIEGLNISRYEQAVDSLERLANSLFFQLDITRNAPLGLARRRPLQRRRFGNRAGAETKDIEFPKSEYDRDPISLYWYARSATGMPLLQFLAYYQTLEYYFPSYSKAEARRKIRNILKNPAFRPDRDTDLTKILVAARPSGQGYGDERSQLRATVSECVEPGALREFLTEFEERSQFFSSKTEGLTDHKLPIRNAEADLRNDVADRLYDIRCKIVHTKSGGRDGEMDLLLPFSKEAELLYADIELIQFIAREVLVSASSALRL